MDNQHRKISGYRELSQEEIDLMNKIKALGPVIEDMIQEVKLHLTNQVIKANEAGEWETIERHDQATPARWANIAATGFQQDLMALTRAVAQPTFF